jgi:hypothetical protein
MDRDVVFIVGTGRSGSSALTRVLSLCGAALPKRPLAPNFANPTGYWEPELAVEINDRFLAAHSSSWYDVSPALQLNGVHDPSREAFVAEMTALLSDGFEAGGPIVVKEPRISGLLPYWIKAASAAGLRVKIVHNFRRPDDVAASLAHRDGIPPEHSDALWLKYNLISERDARAFPRVFVAYEDLMNDWRRVATDCIARLGLRLTISDVTASGVDEFLSRDLQHHASPGDRPVAGGEGLIARTYDLLNAAKHGDAAPAAFDAILAEYVAANQALGPPV